MSVNEKMTAIAEAIRDKTGGSEPLSLDNMAEEIPNIYTAGEEAGRNAEWSLFWDAFQHRGGRREYQKLFSSNDWNSENFKPKYTIIPTGASNANQMFFHFGEGVSASLPQFDAVAWGEVIGKEVFNLKEASYFPYAFATSAISRLGKIDLSSATALDYTFTGMYNTSRGLKEIKHLICSEKTTFATTTFQQTYSLYKVNFEGVIAKNGLTLNHTCLNHDSLMSMINCLKDYSEDTSGTVWKVTLGSTLLAKLTDEEIEIASGKGWQLV